MGIPWTFHITSFITHPNVGLLALNIIPTFDSLVYKTEVCSQMLKKDQNNKSENLNNKPFNLALHITCLSKIKGKFQIRFNQIAPELL